jgi:hypothetical protein
VRISCEKDVNDSSSSELMEARGGRSGELYDWRPTSELLDARDRIDGGVC